VIAGAGLSGILLGNQNANGGVHDNLIQGNLIGTDIT